jgi:hypothetical protein
MTLQADFIMTAKKEAVKKHQGGSRREAHQKSRLYDSFQEEIANTYFKTSPTGKKASRKKKASKAPWIVAALAASIAVAVFISKSNFDIKVRVVSGTPFITSDGAAASPDGAQFLVRGGEPDRSVAAKAFFVGDGRFASSMSDSQITLSNAKGQGISSFIIELKNPADLTRFSIRYSARGAVGAEKIVPVVTDSQNRSYRISDASITSLSDSWRTYIIDFKPVRADIDLKSVSAIKFEFGTETAGNDQAAVMFVKDISLVKAKRIKWL